MHTPQHFDRECGGLDRSFGEYSSISSGLSAGEIIRCINDKKTLSLFRAVAVLESRRSGTLKSKVKLTRKQYYKRIEKLMHIGLVNRIGGRYRLTSFGKVVFNLLIRVLEFAVKYHRELKSIDPITMVSTKARKSRLDEHQSAMNNEAKNQQIQDMHVS
jgi:DNA-binding HxlR family transcriptional regulator